MSRPVHAPVFAALVALLAAAEPLAQPTAPLFVVEQQRAAIVARLSKQWSEAFAALPAPRRLTEERLANALWALRADRLFAASLAGELEDVERVLAKANEPSTAPGSTPKALGDLNADLTYSPLNPCRILDTRNVGGALAANVARTFDGYSTNFAAQGGTASDCGIPNGVAALAMNVYAVNPTNTGFIKVWPANGTEPAVSTVNYQSGLVAIATGALVPVDRVNSNRFTAKSPAVVDFVADVVGYFRAPGGTIGDITAVTVGAGLSGGGSVGAITLGIAAGGVGTTELAEQAVTSSKLALTSVGTSQLTDYAVTSSKLALASVGTSQLTDNSVTTAKVTNASITKPKLSAGGGTAGQLLGTDGTNLQWMASPATVTPINPLGNIVTTVDGAGMAGMYASIARGLDGRPVISYLDGATNTLKVAKCGDAACTGTSVITPVDSACSSAYYAAYTSIAVGTDGMPVISYVGPVPGGCGLKVAKCANAACTGTSTLTTVDPGTSAGWYSSITLGADGLPVISYRNGTPTTPGQLKVAKCANAACTGSSTITTIATGVSSQGVGVFTSIALGADGLPVISFFEADSGRMTVGKCVNAACSSGTIFNIVESGGDATAIALGADGLPVIAYRDYVNTALKVAKCADAACSAPSTITTIDSPGDVGYLVSITLGQDGLPIVSYFDNTNKDLKVAKCANPACTGASTISVVDSIGDVGWFTSITLGTDGLPVIAYHDITNGDLKVVKCSSPTCMPFVRSR